MFNTLRKRAPGIIVSDYIGFFSLRSWGVMNNKVVSDQVYVHDKLMIVDDRVAIIGSANINDRSMIGCRDSEMALRIEDTFHLGECCVMLLLCFVCVVLFCFVLCFIVLCCVVLCNVMLCLFLVVVLICTKVALPSPCKVDVAFNSS